MKNIFLFFLLSLSLSASAQYPLSQNGYLNLNGKQYGWANGTDTIAKMYIDRVKLFKPAVMGGYTTGGLPTAATFPGAWVFNLDSLKMYYSNGSAWTDPANSIAAGSVTSVSAGLGMSFTTITSSGPVKVDTSYLMTQNTAQAPSGNKTFTGVVNLNGGGNTFIKGGNAFSAIAKFGTTDNNQIDIVTNNANAMSIFPGGLVLIGGSGTAPSQKLYVAGTLRLDGTITTGANSGFSVLSGFSFSSFAANNGSNNIGFLWGMNNAFSTGTKSFMTIGGDASLASGTSSVTQLNINPVYNSAGSGTYTLRGVYYNPTLTSLTNTTHIAFENVSGNNRFNSTSGTSTFFGNTIFAVPTTSIPSFNLPPSSAVNPSSPSDGDIWYNGTNLNFRHGGATSDLLATISVTGANDITYNSSANAFEAGGAYNRDTYTAGGSFSRYFGTNASNLDSFAVWAGTIAFNKVPVVAGAPTVIAYTGFDHYAQTTSIFEGTNAPIDGVYEVSGWALINSISSASIKLQVTFNDHNNVTQTIDLFPNGATTVLNSTTGYYIYPSFSFRAKAGVAFGVNVIKAGTSVNYDYGWTIKQLRP